VKAFKGEPEGRSEPECRDLSYYFVKISAQHFLSQSSIMAENSDAPFQNMSWFGLTIFEQDWWLKIARGSGCLKEVQVQGSSGAVIGGLTYVMQRNAIGIASGGSAHLSRLNAPIVSDALSESEKASALAQLIDKLPNISFSFSISQHTPNAALIRQAFECAGFQCSEQINYSQTPEDCVNRQGKKLREHIKQARNQLNIIDLSPDEFISFYQDNLRAADNKKCYFPIETARGLITASLNRSPPQARIIAAHKKAAKRFCEQPTIDAAICIVWDDKRCYYWLSSRHNESHPDAIKLLIATAMEHAKMLGLTFDADGANTPGAQRLFKTIFRMANEERRYVLTRTSRLSQLYESNRSKVDKVKKIAVSLGLRQ
jgi:hypothetical protein